MPAQPVGSVPAALRASLELPAFYRKHIDLEGFPILGSARVSDPAMREAAWILKRLTAHRPELLPVMAAQGARLVVMAHNEYTTDLPEQAGMTPRVFWDRRRRILGRRRPESVGNHVQGAGILRQSVSQPSPRAGRGTSWISAWSRASACSP